MGSSPSTPSLADTIAAANATAIGNQNAAINNKTVNTTNQILPGGNAVTYTTNVPSDYGSNYLTPEQQAKIQQTGHDQFGNAPIDMTGWPEARKAYYWEHGSRPDGTELKQLPLTSTQTVSLGENDQKLFDANQQQNLAMSDLSVTGLDAVKKVVTGDNLKYNPLQFGAGTTADQMTRGVELPTLNGNIADSGQIQGQIANAGNIQTSVGDAGQIKNSITNAGKISGQIANAGNITSNANAGNQAVDNLQNNAGRIQTSIGNVGQIQNNIASAGQVQNRVANAGNISTGIANAGNIVSNANANNQAVDKLQNNSGQIQTGVNLQNVGVNVANNSNQIKTSTGIDPQLLNQQTQDALYKANTQYLDPQFQQSQNALESKLANQGITKGSEAYNNEMLNFNNQKQQAYESARNNSISGSTAAAQGMFGMGLQNATFTNNALGQQFGQSLSSAQLAQQAQEANNANALAAQQAKNAALGQQFTQDLTANQNTNAVANQNNATSLANAGFTNSAQAQQFGQNSAQNAAQNAAQAQQYAQNSNNTAVANAAQNQVYNQNTSNANFTNAAQQQAYAQSVGKATLNNTALNQQFDQNLSANQNANAVANQNNMTNLANAGFTNASQAQQFGQNQAQNATQNSAQAQQYAQNTGDANFSNAAQLQKYNQQLASAGFTNAAQGQQYGQNSGDATFANAAQAQTFGQNSAKTAAQNEAAQGMFNAGISNANMNNQVESQLFGQNLANANMNNAASTQDFQLQQAQQQNPLNILQALRTGSMLQTANVPQVQASAAAQAPAWQGADLLGATQSYGQLAQSAQNADSALMGSIISGVLGGAGAIGGGYLSSLGGKK